MCHIWKHVAWVHLLDREPHKAVFALDRAEPHIATNATHWRQELWTALVEAQTGQTLAAKDRVLAVGNAVRPLAAQGDQDAIHALGWHAWTLGMVCLEVEYTAYADAARLEGVQLAYRLGDARLSRELDRLAKAVRAQRRLG